MSNNARRFSHSCALFVMLFVLPQAAHAQPVVADGFEDSLVAAVPFPTAMAMLPDGRVLITSQMGQLYVYVNGALLETPALDLGGDVCTFRERGLVGLAVDPAFATNRFIFVSYVVKREGACDVEWTGAPAGRVSRFVLGDDNTIDGASEKVLIDNIPSPIGVHNIDDVEFGKDGYLYVSVGDGGCDYMDDSGCFEANDAARDMHALVGKVLRITRDGDVPADNPFMGANTVSCATGRGEPGQVCREIFATGLRNPWRLAFDPNAASTRFFINDVGQDAWEEINEGRAGADYGWNLREAQCWNGTTDCSTAPVEGLTNPVFFYDRSEGCGSITGGAFVPAGAWPAEFDGLYLFSDYVCGTIFKLVPGGDGSFAREPFVTGLGDSSATDLSFVQEGGNYALYYTTYANGGEVRRITHVGGANRRPVAAVTASPASGLAPLVVSFDAGGSADPDGDTLTYEWNFGDGTTVIAGPTVSHSYGWEGTYYATVAVTDPSGSTGTASVFIDVGNTAPVPRILSPAADLLFAVGETILLRGAATDAEDGELSDASLTWRVILHHNAHTHGFISPTAGNSISFTAPGPENLQAAATSYLEVQLTATDRNGLTATVSQALRPRFSRLTFTTDPAGATLRIGNATVTAPVTVSSWVNFAVAVEAPPQPGGDGSALAFRSWSDGGAASHTVVTPAGDTTYTATFGSGTGTPDPPLQRSASASSIESADFGPMNAIDGNSATRWSSAYSDPQWLTVDLGQTLSVDRVRLSWEAAFATAYSVQVSDDNSTWTTVFQTTTGDGGTDDLTNLSARGRYVRVLGTERATPWGYSLWEVGIFEGTSAGGGGGTPYSGVPSALPGLIQAEDFDAGDGALDLTPGNAGGQYRSGDVDIEASSDANGGYNVGWIAPGEWLEYTVNVAAAGNYTLEFRVASPGAGGTFHLEVNGVDRTGPLTIPATGDWQSWTTVATPGVSLTAGQQVWRIVFDEAGPGGAVGNLNFIQVTSSGSPGGPPTSTPFGGSRTALPGLLQVENFDNGGNGVAYQDSTSGNSGSEYRSDDVDIETTADAGGGYNVGWTAPGEWLQYSVTVAAAGTYTLEFRVAAAGAGGTFHLEADGVDITGPLTVPDTGDWQTWTTVTKPGVALTAGEQVWRLVIDGAGSVVGNFNYVRVVAPGGTTDPGPPPTSSPYGGTPASLPGLLQAEHFDNGPSTIAYFDTTPGNTGGELRATDVDIEGTTDSGGGGNLGWVDAGEFLRYTVNVAAAGTYDLEFRVASAGAGGTFHLEIDGADRTGPVMVPDTGGWQQWTTVRRAGVSLTAGSQVWRLVMDANGAAVAVGNFNWIRLTGSTGAGVAIERGPYVQRVTDTSAVLVWTTRTSGAGEVQFGTGGSAVTTTAAQTRLVPATLTGLGFDYYQHEARLSGLTAQTTYDYAIFGGGIEATAGRDRFATAPPVGSGSVRFIAFGDSGVGSSEQRQLASVMAADAFDLSLHGGDVAYGNQDTTGGGDYRQFEDWVFGVYGSWMRARPFFPSIGNHDDEVRSAAPYRDVFVLPDNGTSVDYPDHAERYYSFDYGPVHFIALDTELAFADPARRAVQIAWLRADLAATSQPWRVVYFHRPPYSSGAGHGSDLAVRQAFSPIFEEFGVQLVIAAHEHSYERTTPIREFVPGGSAVIYVVSGGGGARLYPAGQASWTAASASVHHYVRATAGECVLNLQAVGIDGVVFDSFELSRCGAAPAAAAATTADLIRSR